MHFRVLPFLLSLLALVSLADGPADNRVESVRPVPPPGVALSEADRQDLRQRADRLGEELVQARRAVEGKPLQGAWADAEIYHKAVRYALEYNEFFRSNEVGVARQLLQQGSERAAALREGKAPWTSATGLVVRGYVSRVDNSVQPYGLVIPATYQPGRPHRLDLWFHGRGETLGEIDFINGRQKSPGEFTPPNAIVLHLYGRYCNGSKFAGETDTLEAIEAVKRNYSIDPDRIVVRGFSLGGAACWHTTVHFASRWAASAPGAGFSETPDFLKVFQNEKLAPSWFEKKLWHWYDCTDYAANIFNCPTVAYSGEIDSQKQAADIMARAMAKEGLELVHLIGPQTAHKYHPETKAELNRRIDAIAERGRDPMPRRVRFTTWTLRYNEMAWVTVDALGEHWERADVDATIDGPAAVSVKTRNVEGLTLRMESGRCPLDASGRPEVRIDGDRVSAPAPGSDRSWEARLVRRNGHWVLAGGGGEAGLRKVHGLQGPIDDAFMDSFVMVHPTGTPLNDKAGAWVTQEERHAVSEWRRQFRGDARVVNDAALSDREIAESNLVLWGDPSSNRVLARLGGQLPIRWDGDSVVVKGRRYASAHHVPVLIYPNPLNPRRYVVINSGFTFREYDQLNNARQVAKLPDWAIIDVNSPVTSRLPGAVADAGFFNERWELQEAGK